MYIFLKFRGQNCFKLSGAMEKKLKEKGKEIK